MRRSWSAILALLPSMQLCASNDDVMHQLRADVAMLAGTIGPRSVFQGDTLQRSADYITGRFEKGGWAVRRLGYRVRDVTCENLEVERRGATRPDEIVIIGAHYDTVPASPGADDNASGVAALLALADWFSEPSRSTQRTLRFVAFVNEEPIYFQTELMGSRVYARACRQRGENVAAMVSLESIGYYSDQPRSQQYPLPLFRLFYPSRGDFLAFVGNFASRALVTQAAKAFRSSTTLPCEAAALPEAVPGIGWSDHWAFWQEGYRAIMVTGTAPYRNPHYHGPTDTPETLDYPRLLSAMTGLRAVVAELANAR